MLSFRCAISLGVFLIHGGECLAAQNRPEYERYTRKLYVYMYLLASGEIDQTIRNVCATSTSSKARHVISS